MRNLKRNVFRIALVECLFAVSGCDGPPTNRPLSHIVADMSISVKNETSGERMVVLEGAAREYELGVIPAFSSRSFSVPSDLDYSTSSLELEARGRFRPELRSNVFKLMPGDRFVWVLRDPGVRPATAR